MKPSDETIQRSDKLIYGANRSCDFGLKYCKKLGPHALIQIASNTAHGSILVRAIVVCFATLSMQARRKVNKSCDRLRFLTIDLPISSTRSPRKLWLSVSCPENWFRAIAAFRSSFGPAPNGIGTLGPSNHRDEAKISDPPILTS